ncbi:type II restriction endonuclease [Escherichia coli]|uniref:type II restriction endonuclease n=1 Tax=Escherichia coli TaxID=562 RepID=UPI003F4ADE12
MDEFIALANSVSNRRKSRAGKSLELHLEHLGVSLDIENYCTLRLFFDLSTLAGLSRRNLPEAGIRLLFQI